MRQSVNARANLTERRLRAALPWLVGIALTTATWLCHLSLHEESFAENGLAICATLCFGSPLLPECCIANCQLDCFADTLGRAIADPAVLHVLVRIFTAWLPREAARRMCMRSQSRLVAQDTAHGLSVGCARFGTHRRRSMCSRPHTAGCWLASRAWVRRWGTVTAHLQRPWMFGSEIRVELSVWFMLILGGREAVAQ